MKTLENHLHALRAGEMSFTEFHARTRPDWRRVARYILRRWAVPDAVELADVEQELLRACWEHVGKWDPARGTSIRRYCVFNSINAAKSFVHVQRAAGHGWDCAPGRYALTFAALGVDLAEHALYANGQQEEAVFRRQVVERAIASCTLPRERLCLRAFFDAGGDVDLASAQLYADTAARRRCRFNCKEDVRRAIQRAAEQTKRREAAWRQQQNEE